MSTSDVISLWEIAKRAPALCAGMPKRLKGLSMVARQNKQTPSGLGLCLEASAQKHPEATALVFEGQSWTYQSLNQWVNRLANAMQDSGTRKGDVVAVFVENRPELLVGVAALAKLGAVAALLNTSQRGGVLQHSLNLVGAKRAIVGAELYDAFKELDLTLSPNQNELIFVADPWAGNELKVPDGWLDFGAISSSGNGSNPLTTKNVCAEDPFCYFYTSGTTGLPKAAVLTHGRFMKAYAGVGLASLQLRSSDRVFICLPFYHATAMAVGWGSVLAGHAALVLERNFSATRFWDIVRSQGVTAFCYVGELCRYLLALEPSGQDKDHGIRLMFGNGLRPNIWKGFKQRYGIDKVFEFYGSSEGNVGFLNMFNFDNTVGFTTVPYAIVEYDLEQDEPVRYADGFMRHVRKGEPGLLLGEITDSSPFDGYTDPEKTEKTIMRNVFKEGDAWFNTGDLMRHQGFRHAQFVDRLGDTYRWKGENVSTAEVENALAAHSAILDGVAYGVEIPGTNGRAGMACVRLKPGAEFDGEALYQQLVKTLPAYAIPVFVRVTQELETTGTHKYKKTDLKAQGFDISQVSDPMWLCLPKGGRYQHLDKSLYDSIANGALSF